MPDQAHSALSRLFDGNANCREITLAAAPLQLGQRFRAFNELYVDAQSHFSALNRITAGRRSEAHSSSGILVSIEAGSAGWVSSIFNMVSAISQFCGRSHLEDTHQMRSKSDAAWQLLSACHLGRTLVRVIPFFWFIEVSSSNNEIHAFHVRTILYSLRWNRLSHTVSCTNIILSIQQSMLRIKDLRSIKVQIFLYSDMFWKAVIPSAAKADSEIV